MHKILEQVDGHWIHRSGQAVFQVEASGSGRPRIRVFAPSDRAGRLIESLLRPMISPFQVLYILHTPRGEGEPGRYQSPEISEEALLAFLLRYSEFFSADSRHDLWIRSAATGCMVIWDRHNDIFLYGDMATLAERLITLGFQMGVVPQIGEHIHHYRAEFDGDAAAVLAALEWHWTPLRPEDQQFVP